MRARRFAFGLVPVLLALASPAAAQVPISIGEWVEGELSASDRRENGRYADSYELQGSQGDRIYIVAESDEMTVNVRVVGHGLDVAVSSNDDGASQYVVRLPADGSYTITVSGEDAGDTGDYQLLLVKRRGGDPDDEAQPLPVPAPSPPPPPVYYTPPPPPVYYSPPPPPSPAPMPMPVVESAVVAPTPVLRRSFLLPNETYRPAQGNLPFGVILLRERGDERRNMVLCRTFINRIQPSSVAAPAGAAPIATYWLLKSEIPAASDGAVTDIEARCQQLIANYDFDRAARILGGYGHSGAGPALLGLQLSRDAGAAPTFFLLNMSRRSDEDIAQLIGNWFTRVQTGQDLSNEGGGFGGLIRRGFCELTGGSGPAGGSFEFFDTELNVRGIIRTVVSAGNILSIGVGVLGDLACEPDAPHVAGLFTLTTPVLNSATLNASAPATTGDTPARTGGLSLTPIPPGTQPPPGTIVQDGSLAEGDGQLADGQYHDDYAITLAANQQIVITAKSTAFDSYVMMFAQAGALPLGVDDNGGGGNDARLTFRATAAGTYRVRVSTPQAGAGGAYQLTITPG